MRVRVGRVQDGIREVIVVPGRASGLPPVVIRGGSKADVMKELRVVIKQVRGDPVGDVPAG